MVPALMRQFAEKFYESLTNEWVAHHVTNYMPSKTSKEGASKAHEIENSPIMARSKCLHNRQNNRVCTTLSLDDI